MEVVFEYELLNFVWETSYDFDTDHVSSKVRDESDQLEPDSNLVSALSCDAVGVRRGSLDKIQYGITAIEEGERIAPVISKNGKKKAPHK